MIRRKAPLTPLSTALWAGLTGGLLFGFVDNMPCLLQGDGLGHLRIRLQAMMYTTVLYALAFAAVLGVLGLALTILLALFRMPARRAALLGLYAGLLASTVCAISWLQANGVFELPPDDPNRPLTILLGCLAGAAAGILVGWATHRLAHWWDTESEPNLPLLGWALQWGPPLALIISVLLIAGLGLYRNVLSDLPLLRPAQRTAPASAERPNIVLITVASLRADHLGAYGYDPTISPNIDALARRGILFRQAIAQSSWTLPSVASMITSMYPTELGLFAWRDIQMQVELDPLRTTLAEALHAGGYRTQSLLTNAWLTPETGFGQGFDDAVSIRLPQPYDYESLVQRPLLGFFHDHGPEVLGDLLRQSHALLFDQRLTGANDGMYVNSYAQGFLERHQNERFFLWLYYMEPHPTYAPSELFPPLPPALADTRLNSLRKLTFWTLADSGSGILQQQDLSALVSLYDGEIHDLDHWIGELGADLDRLGLSDRTIVVLHGDHGQEFFEHGGFAHGHTLYDELISVPLIIAGPGIIDPGRSVDSPVQLLDLMPTLLELARVPIPEEARGRSLVPLLRGEELDEVPIYSELLLTTFYDREAIRYQGYKLIYGAVDEQVELYDLQTDPRETVNLAEGDPDRAAEYLRLLEGWLAEATDRAANLPRSSPRAGINERVLELLREGGY